MKNGLITKLAREMAEVSDVINRTDRAWLDAETHDEKERTDLEFREAYARSEGLRNAVVTLPAKSLEEVIVQLAAAQDLVSDIYQQASIDRDRDQNCVKLKIVLHSAINALEAATGTTSEKLCGTVYGRRHSDPRKLVRQHDDDIPF